MANLARQVRQSTICPLKKPGFSIIFAKNSPAKGIFQPKISAPVNSDVANAAKQKANGSFKCVCRKLASKLRNAVGNWECRTCFKNFSLFLTKTDGKKLIKISLQARQLKSAPSISVKTIAFPSVL